MTSFHIGNQYSKNDIYTILNVPVELQRGAWDTGSREYNGQIFIFANIETSGRTGHDYSNHWIGDTLHWHAKLKSNLAQPSIQKLINPEINKHIFTRTDNRSPFTYEGLGYVESYKNESPVQITWTFKKLNDIDLVSEEEVEYGKLKEGAVQRISINAYERNPEARRRCLDSFGYICSICSFDYYKIYGEYGKDYIQVHHIIPIAEIKEEYELDPLVDLTPVCANCHSIIHRKKKALLPEEVKKMIFKK